MEILNLFSPDEFRHFLLILMRVSIVLFLFPIFGSNMFPVLAKAGLSLVITLALFSSAYADPAMFPEKVALVPIVIISELFIGLSLALTVRFFFAAAQIAGVVIGFQMGFSMINVVDPQSGSQVSVMDQIAFWVVIIVFLAINGHHIIIRALTESFYIIPVGSGFYLNKGLYDLVVSFGTNMFVLGLKIGAPVIAALFFTSVAFGITAKFAPQINIMIVAFPLKIVVGLFLFGAALDVASHFTMNFTHELYGVFFHMLKLLSGNIAG